MKRPARALLFAFALFPLLTLAPRAAEARKLGDAKLLSGPVACGAADCYELEVTCPKVSEPAVAILKVSGPALSAAESGTIYFATGGGGAAFWGEAYGSTARKVLRRLQDRGFRTVEVSWEDRWLDGAPTAHEGQVKLACRPATAARWIYDNLHPLGAAAGFCATGNSGGSSQVSYMLSHYKLAKILDAVVPTSGPPMGRIDMGCFDSQDPDLPTMTYGSSPRQAIDRSWGYYRNDGPCARRDDSFRKRFKKASVAARKSKKYHYPKTMVAFVFGADDNSSAVGQGVIFYQKLIAAETPLLKMSITENTPHTAPSANKGAKEIFDILVDHCAPQE